MHYPLTLKQYIMEPYVIIGLILIISFALWIAFRKRDDEAKTIPWPKDETWDGDLESIKTALRNVKTQEDLIKVQKSFSSIVNKWSNNSEFMSRYLQIMEEWRIKNL